MSWLEVVLRLAVALACGAAIGIERQYRQHSAGLRTSALVATGSALFMLVAALSPNGSNPTGIAAQVVSGVGFLCAGVIIRDGLNIRGLNTAGTLWCASGVGVLFANLLLRPLARFLDRHAKTTGDTGEVPVHYVLRAVCLSQQENHIRSLLLQGVSGSDLTLQALQSADTPDPTRVEVRADLQTDGRKDAPRTCCRALEPGREHQFGALGSRLP
jgi:putative Mg2+ transporter-C (MgtC) family protein